MKLLNPLKAICPHCQHQFWHYDTLRGINFCPKCHNSFLLKQYDPSGNRFSTASALALIGLNFVLAYVIQKWSNHTIISMLESLFIYGIGSILILLVVIILLSLTIFRHTLTKFAKIKAGVDQFNEVKEDVGEYRLNGVNESALNIACPNCGSQRLQSLYWYKTNLAKRYPDITAPKAIDSDFMSDNFVGCLNCKSCYRKRPHKMSYLNIIIGLVVITLLMSFKVSPDSSLVTNIIHYLPVSASEVSYIIKSLILSIWLYLILRLSALAKSSSGLKLEPIDEVEQ
ncbi:MAG: hypothetical protein Q4P13_01725 [Psychrobacter sp.]|nr:hypothetical protein [Psychrobacter sp.]